MIKIKSHTEYHTSDGYDIDEVVERVTNKFVEDALVPIHYIVSINTTPIYKVTDGGCLVKGVFITIVYKEVVKSTYEWTTTCEHCGCIFSYDELDVVEDDFGNRFVECPDCGGEITFGVGARSRKD